MARVIWDSESFPETLLLHLCASICPTTSMEEIPLLEQPLGTQGRGPSQKTQESIGTVHTRTQAGTTNSSAHSSPAAQLVQGVLAAG